MKKAMQLVLMYFEYLFASIILGTLIYSLYLNVINFVTGSPINLFNTDDLFHALFYMMYLSLFFVHPLLALYRTRHKSDLPQIIAYVILVLITWGALFPGTVLLERFYYSKYPENKIEKNLSGKHFRQLDNKVYYFTRDFYSNPINFDETTTVVIDTSEDGDVEILKIKDTYDFELYTQANPYRDILIKRAFQRYSVPHLLDFGMIIRSGKECFNDSWLNYLGFCSLGILIAMVFAMTDFFKWRLLNVCLILFTDFLVLGFNTAVRFGKIAVIINKIWGIPFVKVLGNVFDNPVLFLINSLCAFVIFVTGIVMVIVKNYQKKKAEN